MCEKALTFLALCGIVLLLFGGVAFLAWMDVREHERLMREIRREREIRRVRDDAEEEI